MSILLPPVDLWKPDKSVRAALKRGNAKLRRKYKRAASQRPSRFKPERRACQHCSQTFTAFSPSWMLCSRCFKQRNANALNEDQREHLHSIKNE